MSVCTYKSAFMFVLRIYNTHPQTHTHSRIIPNHPLFQMNLINFHAITLRFGVCGDKSGHGIYKNSLTELHTREKRNKKRPTTNSASPSISLCGTSLPENSLSCGFIEKLVTFLSLVSTSAKAKHKIATVSVFPTVIQG